MTVVTEAISSFLIVRQNPHNADLVERWSPAMETQVNVQTSKGVPVEGKENVYCHTYPQGFTCEFWHIRVPKNADSEPKWRDYELEWPPDEFAEAIGSTGWDWQHRVSRWVGFDFDSIAGHVAVGISDERLAEVKEAASGLPYVEVRKSTSGSGLHLYVHVDTIRTENHTVHAHLAKRILIKMGADCGYDFLQQGGQRVVDACGGNMWIWHLKMTAENEGLKLLKPAERILTAEELPSNWRDQLAAAPERSTNGKPASRALLKAAHRYAAKCDGVSQGGRNNAAFQIAGHLAAFEGLQTGSRLNQEQIIEIMRGWNIQNDPPLDESELMRAVQSGMNNGTPRPAKLVAEDDGGDTWLSSGPDSGASHVESSSKETDSPLPVCTSRLDDNYVPFPVHTLPSPVSEYVQAASESIGCDPSYVAVPLLACLAQAVSNKRVIQLKSSWCEPSVIWGAIVGESGTHKSPALILGTEILFDRQLKKIESDNERIDHYEQAQKRYKFELRAWERLFEQATKECMPPPPMPAEPEEPVCERFITTDATVEAIILMLSRQRGGLLMSRDELSGWLRGMGEYKRGSKGGSDLGHWLGFWNAAPAQKDRSGSKSLTVRHAAVSVVGGIPPKVLKDVIGREHLEDGLCQRFLLVMPPERPVVWMDRSVDLDTRKELEDLFDRLLDIETPVEPTRILLSASAKRIWVPHFNRHRDKLLRMENALRSAFSKLEAYTARFALIFEAIKGGTEIAADTIQSAIELSDWFGGEARRVYAMFGSATRETSDLLELIRGWGGEATVGKLQEASRKYRDGVGKTALDGLVREGHGRWDGHIFRLGA